MKACILTVAALLLVAGGTGCHGMNLAKRGCNECGHGRHGGMAAHGGGGGIGSHGPRGTAGVPHHQTREYNGPAGPPTAQVAYPYYTTRGPRDFLQNNPPSIGR